MSLLLLSVVVIVLCANSVSYSLIDSCGSDHSSGFMHLSFKDVVPDVIHPLLHSL